MGEPKYQLKLGTAEWADPAYIAENFRFSGGKFWLGRAPGSGVPVGYDDDRHICLVSGSRAGKGTTTIVPNLCLWPGSLVCIDPKGENATITAARRGPGSANCGGMGQSVHVLDPFEAATVPPGLRARFNPLDALDPNDEESIDEAGRIADALVVINPESKDPFWDESARAMLKGLILHVLTSPDFEGRRNLVTIRELISRGDVQAVESLQEQGETNIASAQELLWQGVRSNGALQGVIAGAGDTFGNMAINSPKQFESVLQVANRNTEFIDSPGMRRCLEASDFQLSNLKTKKEGVSLYLSLPQRYMSTHFRWLRMMIALTVTEMEKVKGHPATGHRVLMCLDEFAGLRRMEVIENAVAQIAGNGVKMMFVLQSLEQLKATYKEKWETFLANCGIKMFFGVEDHFTREYVSKFVGETEVIRETNTASEAEGTSESHSHNVSRGRSTTRSGNTTQSSGSSTGRSGGTTTSESTSEGSSQGASWNPLLGLLRRNRQFNEGTNRSSGSSRGSNRGWSLTTTEGLARSLGFSVTDSSTVSEGTTSGMTQTRTRGVSEGIHKRALITPDEIGALFRRIDDPAHPAYPGLALVLLSGESPLALKRVTYYADGLFRKHYDPHPHHPQVTSWRELELSPPDKETVFWAAARRSEVKFQLHVATGGTVRKGEPFLTIDCSDFQYANDWVPWRSRVNPYDKRSVSFRSDVPTEVTLCAPVGGYVLRAGDVYGSTTLYTGRRHGVDPDFDWSKLTLLIAACEPFDSQIEDRNRDALVEQCLLKRDALKEEMGRLSRLTLGLIGVTLFLAFTAGSALWNGIFEAAAVWGILTLVLAVAARVQWVTVRGYEAAIERAPLPPLSRQF